MCPIDEGKKAKVKKEDVNGFRRVVDTRSHFGGEPP